MADVSKIFKPRRGKKSTMTGTKASTILAAGELFVEVPDAGVGKGAGKLKMGDGSTPYSSLPYLMGDTSNDKITLSSNTRTTVATALNDAASGATLATMIAALKQAISLSDARVTKLNDDLASKAAGTHTHDDRYFTESEINSKLSGYSTTSHTHDYSGSFAAKSHGHAYTEITGRPTFSLNGTTLYINF